MIQFEIDEESRQRLQSYLESLGPRLMAEVHRQLKILVYQGVQAGIEKYFAGSAAKGTPASPNRLTSRSGALVNSIIDSVMTGIDPATPSAGTQQITLRVGSDLPYARIHEYGGYAGRRPPFKKKDGRRPYLPARPYLEPIFNDLQAALPGMLQESVAAAIGSQ